MFKQRKWWPVIVACVAVLIVGEIGSHLVNHKVHAALAAAPAATIDPLMSFQGLIAKLMATGGGWGAVLASILAIASKWTDSLPEGQGKKAGKVAISLGRQLMYRKIYDELVKDGSPAALHQAACIRSAAIGERNDQTANWWPEMTPDPPQSAVG